MATSIDGGKFKRIIIRNVKFGAHSANKNILKVKTSQKYLKIKCGAGGA